VLKRPAALLLGQLQPGILGRRALPPGRLGGLGAASTLFTTGC
jgi:hypothetical protein